LADPLLTSQVGEEAEISLGNMAREDEETEVVSLPVGLHFINSPLPMNNNDFGGYLHV